jgi:transposase-like protein
MARPRTIPWEKRVSIFLAYRRTGAQVNQVAKNHGVAKSTVTSLANEFKGMGFSDRPRAKVSSAILHKMQEQHIQRVLPMSVGLKELALATHEKAALEHMGPDPLPVPPELRWHLKGTPAEETIQHAREAAIDFHERDYDAWRNLRLALEGACQVPCRASPVREDGEPHLLLALVRRVRDSLMARAFGERPPYPPGQLEWDTEPDDAAILTLGKEMVAIGSPEDHKKIKEGVAHFYTTSFYELQRRFLEVEGLWHDLGLMQTVLLEAIANVQESEKRRGICPACPYPEARADPSPSQELSKGNGRREPREQLQGRSNLGQDEHRRATGTQPGFPSGRGPSSAYQST